MLKNNPASIDSVSPSEIRYILKDPIPFLPQINYYPQITPVESHFQWGRKATFNWAGADYTD